MKKASLGGMWGKMGTAERGKKGRESRVMGARVGWEETIDLWPAEEGNQKFSKAKAEFSLVWLKGGELVMGESARWRRGGWSPCKNKSKAKGGGAAWFRPNTKKLGLGFFRGCPKFLSLKIVLCQFFFPPLAYGWMFTYIENLYACNLRKYCNNYCRDCLL